MNLHEVIAEYVAKDAELTLELYRHMERAERTRRIKGWTLFAGLVIGVIALRLLLN